MDIRHRLAGGGYGSTKFAVEGITEALYAELKPLGIHVSVIEPGFFRTDFMDSSSLVRTKVEIEDYRGTVGKTRSFAGEHNQRLLGNPANLVKTLLELAALSEPPVRLQLGSDAVKRIEQKNALVYSESQRRLSLSTSTNFNQD